MDRDSIGKAVELTNSAAHELIKFCHRIGNRRATDEQLAHYVAMANRSNAAGALWAVEQSRTQEGRDLMSKMFQGHSSPVEPEEARPEFKAITNLSGEIFDKIGEDLPGLDVEVLKEAMDKSSEFVLRQDHMERLIPMLG